MFFGWIDCQQQRLHVRKQILLKILDVSYISSEREFSNNSLIFWNIIFNFYSMKKSPDFRDKFELTISWSRDRSFDLRKTGMERMQDVKKMMGRNKRAHPGGTFKYEVKKYKNKDYFTHWETLITRCSESDIYWHSPRSNQSEFRKGSLLRERGVGFLSLT